MPQDGLGDEQVDSNSTGERPGRGGDAASAGDRWRGESGERREEALGEKRARGRQDAAAAGRAQVGGARGAGSGACRAESGRGTPGDVSCDVDVSSWQTLLAHAR